MGRRPARDPRAIRRTMMKVLGRWMPTLGLAACLAAAGCKKEEAPTPPPAEPTVPAAQPPDAGATPASAPTPTPTPPPGSQAARPEEANNREWTAGLVDVKRSGFEIGRASCRERV